MPQTAALRRRLPATASRRKQTRGRPGRTLGGGSVVQRGQLKPRTLTLRTSHFPDPPAATIQPTNPGLDTERRRLGRGDAVQLATTTMTPGGWSATSGIRGWTGA